ncbi:hypothetical protein ACFRCQ_15055 [Cytobacillus firmus]|uniref:hypothetical protein n=1 Tax=Cytobacillus firmus TaxID=1399 RepID=UPI0036839F4E
MNKTEMLKLFVLIERVYPPFRIKNEIVHYYFDHCLEFDYEIAFNSLKEHIRKSPYPPSISHIGGIAKMADFRNWEQEYVLADHV